jgi:hypothetical protein
VARGPFAVALAALLSLAAARSATAGEDDDISSLEPNRGAASSPVDLVPRLELRQSFVSFGGGVTLHDTTLQMDIQFLNRVLLRYEGVVRVLAGPAGQTSGFGDARVQALTLFAVSPRFVAATITGAVLDSASQPALGTGKTQILLGAGAAGKPLRWWLPFLVVVEQLSVAGDPRRPDINVLTIDAGSILFGKGQTWYRLDLQPVVDIDAGTGRLLGEAEVGRLLFGKTGLFMRAGTQLAGSRILDYSIEVGARYLFRLGEPAPR